MPEKMSSILLPDLSTIMGVNIDASVFTAPTIIGAISVETLPPAATKIVCI